MLNIEIETGGIAIVTIDMPGRTMNVLDLPLTDALGEMAETMASNPDVRGVILTSAKSDFIAGADLSMVKAFFAPGQTPVEIAATVSRIGNAFRKIERMGKPLVVAAPGTALGAGLELMMACQYRIAARNNRALFGLPEVSLGILAAAGGTQRLPRIVGLEAALSMLTGGKPINAEKALEIGLLDEVVETDDLIPAARRALTEGRVPDTAPWDREGFRLPGVDVNAIGGFNLFITANAAIAADPGPAYPAPQAVLSCVWEGLRLPIDRALALEWQYFAKLASDPVADALIGVRFFARQRAAKAGLRRPDPQSPLALACRAAIVAEAERLRDAGIPSNRINNAALAMDLKPTPLPLSEAGGDFTAAEPADHAVLLSVVRRLLLAGALAVARENRENPDVANFNVVDATGYPAWTGGPLALIDREGLGRLVAEARNQGIAIPGTLKIR